MGLMLTSFRCAVAHHGRKIEKHERTSMGILHLQILRFRCHHCHCIHPRASLPPFLPSLNPQPSTLNTLTRSQLLAPAQDYLKSECLSGPITEYPWVEGIALMTIFSMFFLELMASRFDFGPKHSHDNDLESSPAVTPGGSMLMTNTTHSHSHNHGKTHHHTDAIRANTADDSSSSSDHHHDPNKLEPYSDIPVAQRTTSQFAEFPGNSDHLSHQRNHHENENFAAQMTSIFILEFGVIFHSIFIGLTLAVAGDEFVVLYIVLVFHQTFEGLGLGSRLGTMEWPKSKGWMPWVLGAAYGFTTPIAIAIGLGIRETFVPGSTTYLMVNGIFDSISAGILIYTGLVELMAHEFMFNAEMRKGSMTKVLSAFGCMCFGAGLMALLGKWA